MKNFPLLITIFLLYFCNVVGAQESNKIVEVLKTKFENFEYEKVISISDSVLNSSKKISKEDSIQIYYYRSLAAFNLWDINLSEEGFKIILNLNRNFTLDSSEVSPKIISFFNQIKSREEKENNYNSRKTNETETHHIRTYEQEIKKNFSVYREALWKNLIFPGLGNLILNAKTKGYLISTSFSISIILSTYFYIETQKREKDYLTEIDPSKISEKYSSYNNAYKIRNLSLIALSLIYLYSQIDIFINPPDALKTNLNYSIQFQSSPDLIEFKFSVPFN